LEQTIDAGGKDLFLPRLGVIPLHHTHAAQ
jgi:hypothetical protein